MSVLLGQIGVVYMLVVLTPLDASGLQNVMLDLKEMVQNVSVRKLKIDDIT